MTKRILLNGLVFLTMSFTTIGQSKIAILPAGKGASEVADYARNELTHFLGNYYTITADPALASTIVYLATDSMLPEGSFSVDNRSKLDKSIIRLYGSDETAMLHAVYTFLELAGIRFEATGPVLPARLHIDSIRRALVVTRPFVKRRGIRQHINFPMDMSSYPLDEAKAYIRNLARLRFNYIAFHSYPGQWYEVHRKDTTEYAGNFFYGQQYTIPAQDLLQKKIRNKTIYCIPSIEPFYNDTATRSKMAIAWLQEVMKECRRVGLSIRFSFEARSASTDVSGTVETAKAILSLYPQIDELELMGEETGGWETPATRAETEQMLARHFGDSILKDGVVMAPVKDGQPGLAYLFGSIGHNIAAYAIINDSLLRPRKIKGSLGIYITIPDYLKACYSLLRKYAPNAEYSVMPAHGARKTALQLPLVSMGRKDWEKTMVYSWIEFDGIMYLQQNELRGIRRLLEYAEDVNGPGNPIGSVCFNHWRLAENRVTMRYAALSTLYGAMDESVFYADYARGLGIRETSLFAAAMKKLDDAGWYATTDLPNVGFCFAGTWGKGFGTFGRMNRDKLPRGRALYEEASAMIRQCAAHVRDTAGRSMLSFLDNRLRATIVYFKAYEKAATLQKYVRSPSFSAADKKDIAEICNQSLLLFGQYMQLHAAMMPDRSTEGTLISVFHTPVAILQRIRYEYAGIPYTDQPVTDKKVDAPPPPITFQ